MKRKLMLGLLISALALPLTLPISAAEDTVMIEQESEWSYTVTDNDGFDSMDPDWMTLDFDPDWQIRVAPFGDRLDHTQAEKYGWTGENYGIFLRQTFKLRSATVMKDMHFYLRIYYDNSVHVYLNGTEIFAHDDGGSGDWVDDYVLIELDDVSSLLEKGANVLAVSVHDNMGGREFDLSFFATVEPLDEETVSPPDEPDQPDIPNKPDDPDTGDDPVGTMAPEDFGSSLPFTNAPVLTDDSPIVTVYVTAEPVEAAPAEKVSYTAPLAMVGGALAIAALMVITALLISRRRGRSGGTQ
ncbi:MAG: hypothetical protein IJX76_02655 [Clostridia bacterium]|nr:hypothetical protein [Clostridia bacterium]